MNPRYVYPLSHERRVTETAQIMADMLFLPWDLWCIWCVAFHNEFRRKP